MYRRPPPQERRIRSTKVLGTPPVATTCMWGRAYGIEVHGLQGISTAAEFGIKDMSTSAQFILDRGLSTVFIETSVNSKSIEALQEAVVQKGGKVKIGAPLFSDALGEQGTTEATLLGAFRHNTNQILKSFN